MPNAPVPPTLVGGLYAVDVTRPRADFVGRRAFTAHRDGHGEFVAIEATPDAPPRARALELLLASPVTGVLNPIAHGRASAADGKRGYYVICSLPPGPSVAPPRTWAETELLADVLRPVAAALARLEEKGLTHRGIRPSNLFQASRGESVLLGPAWAAPPASAQPALYEPPAVAICDRAGRGEGTTAEDIYALGVVLLVLALGHEPMADTEAVAVCRRKVALGSFAALTEGERVPRGLRDILRLMLADDPALRPAPSAFLDGHGTSAQRVTRWQRRAPDPLVLGGVEVTDARGLATAMITAPEETLRLLHLGVIGRWIRRDLGDPPRAQRIEQMVESAGREANTTRADAFLFMRTVALIDPLAPLGWRGVAFFPAGMAPLLARGDLQPWLTELIETEVIAAWASMHPEGPTEVALRFEARRCRLVLRRPGWAGGLARLRYALNPLLPCQSPLVQEQRPVDLASLLAALEVAAAKAENLAGAPIDAEIAGFALTHGAAELEPELSLFPGNPKSSGYALSLLKIFRGLAAHAHAGPYPALGRWLAARAEPAVVTWREKKVREARKGRLMQLAEQGNLGAMATLLEDPAGRARDAEGFRRAVGALRRLDAELARVSAGSERRAATAKRLGQELASGVGLVAVAGTLLVLALG